MAKHYIARTVTETPAYMQAKIVVPAAETLHAGQVVVAEELDAGLGYGNWDVYTAGKVANIAKDNIAIKTFIFTSPYSVLFYDANFQAI